ncbi:hypothetical protein DL240_10885 [Lujinxingia litoralis]|uniref:Uncharacterized protein n=1 Tax=Lujinxingia litoralis TaxID=2211119 RepID=A0A328C5Q7_9DELT|nr:hypothetical protein [Lujinxingia litoralis]RAL22346.1 hypothetical protein DL240_10885 [Lujinxingia litoralis]
MRRTRHPLSALLLLSTLTLGTACESTDTSSPAQTTTELTPYQAPEAPAAAEAAPGPVAFPSNDWTCDAASVDRVQSWIDAARPLPAKTVFAGIEGVSPATRSPGFLIALSDDTLQLGGHDYGDDLDAFKKALQERIASREGAPGAIRLSGPTSAARMQSIAEILAPHTGESLLFAVPLSPAATKVQAPGPAVLARATEQAPPAQCAPVTALLNALPELSPPDRSRKVRAELAGAWLACECDADLEALLAGQIWLSPAAQAVAPAELPLTRLHTWLEEGASWSAFETRLRDLGSGA